MSHNALHSCAEISDLEAVYNLSLTTLIKRKIGDSHIAMVTNIIQIYVWCYQ